MGSTRRNLVLASIWLGTITITSLALAADATPGVPAELLDTSGRVGPPPPATVSGRAADSSGAPARPPAPPRLQLAYRTFAIENVDLASSVPLRGLELSLYPLSGNWFRAGFELGAGSGDTTMSGSAVDLRYGLAGVEAGLQVPGRVSPFVQGRLMGGVLAGTLDGTLSIPGTSYSLSGGSAATWIYGRGVDVGLALYTVGRLHLFGAVGWMRTTWRGPDLEAMTNDPLGGLQTKDLTTDSFTMKIGLGF